MACPFLDSTDDRCGDHFKVGRLAEAFNHCFDKYRRCPIYDRLLAERMRRRPDRQLPAA